MEITEVRIKLMDESSERLQAFCSITFDDSFVVRDLKIIEGANGPFVAMPSRKLTSHCPECSTKNHLRAAYCNQCGLRLKDDRAIKDAEGRAKLYADIAHPINTACREMIQERVIEEFRMEQDRALEPGYISRYEDFDVDIDTFDPPPRSRPQQKQIQPAHDTNPPHKSPAGKAARRNENEGPGGTSGPKSGSRPRREERSEKSNGPENSDFGAGVFSD